MSDYTPAKVVSSCGHGKKERGFIAKVHEEAQLNQTVTKISQTSAEASYHRTPQCIVPKLELPRVTIEVRAGCDPLTGSLILEPCVVSPSPWQTSPRKEIAQETPKPVTAVGGEYWVFIEDDWPRLDAVAADRLLQEILADLIGLDGWLPTEDKPGFAQVDEYDDLRMCVVEQYPSEHSLLEFLVGRHLQRYNATSGINQYCGELCFEDVLRFVKVQELASRNMARTDNQSGSSSAARAAQRMCWTMLTARCMVERTHTASASHQLPPSSPRKSGRRMTTLRLCMLVQTLTLASLRSLQALLAANGPLMTTTGDARCDCTSELWWSMAEFIAEATGNGASPLRDGVEESVDSKSNLRSRRRRDALEVAETTLFQWVCLSHPHLSRVAQLIRMQVISHWLTLLESAQAPSEAAPSPISHSRSAPPVSASYKFVPMVQLLSSWDVLFATDGSPEECIRILNALKPVMFARAAENLTLLWRSHMRPADLPAVKCVLFDFPLLIQVSRQAVELGCRESTARCWLGSLGTKGNIPGGEKETLTDHNGEESSAVSRAVVFAALLLLRVFQSYLLVFQQKQGCHHLLPTGTQLNELVKHSFHLFGVLFLCIPTWEEQLGLKPSCLMSGFLAATMRAVMFLKSLQGLRRIRDDRLLPSAETILEKPVLISAGLWVAINRLLQSACERRVGEATVEGESWGDLQHEFQTCFKAQGRSPPPTSRAEPKQRAAGVESGITNRWIRRAHAGFKRSPGRRLHSCRKSPRSQTQEWQLCFLLGIAMSLILLVLTLYRSRSIHQARRQVETAPTTRETAWNWPPIWA